MKKLFQSGIFAASMLLSSAAVAGPIKYEFDIDYIGTTSIGTANYEVKGTGFFSFFGELALGANDLRTGGFSDFSYSAAFDLINQDNSGEDKLNYISVVMDNIASDAYDSIFVENSLDTYFFGNRANFWSSFVVETNNASPALEAQNILLYHEPGSANTNGTGQYLLTNNDDLFVVNDDRKYSMNMRNTGLGQPIADDSNEVPEPSTWLLMAAGLAFTARRFKSK